MKVEKVVNLDAQSDGQYKWWTMTVFSNLILPNSIAQGFRRILLLERILNCLLIFQQIGGSLCLPFFLLLLVLIAGFCLHHGRATSRDCDNDRLQIQLVVVIVLILLIGIHTIGSQSRPHYLTIVTDPRRRRFGDNAESQDYRNKQHSIRSAHDLVVDTLVESSSTEQGLSCDCVMQAL